MKPKKELVRIVKSPEGEISLDLTGKKNGRGAYICKSRECLAKARKAKRLEKALETMNLTKYWLDRILKKKQIKDEI